MADEITTKRRNLLDGTTWEFGEPGFLVLHVLAVAACAWLVAKAIERRS